MKAESTKRVHGTRRSRINSNQRQEEVEALKQRCLISAVFGWIALERARKGGASNLSCHVF